jgi:protocatechuate 3,4-dioxygenase beta subunit
MYRMPKPGTQPPLLHPPYVSSRKRAPLLPLVPLSHTLSEATGPRFGGDPDPRATDLTRQHPEPPQGERIVVSGQVRDEDGRPLRRALVELWQANAAGRYRHELDQHDAPLDPNFGGAGHVLTDDDGRYRFVTIRPGAYPWRNHANAWRPAHLHFSVFGHAFASRLVTQMYFPGDPLLERDPIYNCTADERARRRLVSAFDWETTLPEHALGYRFDMVLAGSEATPLHASAEPAPATTWQTVGPFFSIGMRRLTASEIAPEGVAGERVTIEGRVTEGDGQPVPDALLEVWQADALGRHGDGAAFHGFGRVATNPEGRFRFSTVKPGATPGPDGTPQAPHLAVSVFARGLMRRLVTRAYFPDDPRNATDFVLSRVEPARRETLVARRTSDGQLAWHVALQGGAETVFFDML